MLVITTRYLILAINIYVSDVGNNDPGISCLNNKNRFLMLVMTIQVSHVGNNHPGISCW